MKILITAIEYIHKHNVVHRDLKLENILLMDKNDPYGLKIIDFGIWGMLSKVGGEVITAGTILYSPPEIISKSNLESNPKIDIWSWGVILYVMLTKEFPFSGDNDYKTFTSIMKDVLKFPSSSKLSKEVRHLIKNMLRKDPDKRYSLKDIKTHPWMKDMFPDYQPNYPDNISIDSHKSDFYDDSNPENKFNKSRRYLK